MAIISFDSFGNASAGAHSDAASDDLSANWWGYTGVTITELASDANGRRCYATGSPGTLAMKAYTTEASEFVIGMRLWVNDITSKRCFAGLASAGYEAYGQIVMDDNGDICFVRDYRGDADISRQSTATVKAPLQSWFYLEVRVLVHDSAGEVEWWIDGSAAGSDTGLDTKFTSTQQAGLIYSVMLDTASVDWNPNDRIADIYALAGSTPLGVCEVWYQAADSAGADADFTPSAGLNHENVDDIGNDGDATYNVSSTLADRDSFLHSDDQGSDPHAVQVLCMASAPDDGSGVLSVGVRSGAADALTEVGLVSGYTGVKSAVLETDPNTMSAWAASAVDAAYTVVENG